MRQKVKQEAILKVQKATADGLRFIREAGADEAVIRLEEPGGILKRAADGRATKIIIPSEIVKEFIGQ